MRRKRKCTRKEFVKKPFLDSRFKKELKLSRLRSNHREPKLKPNLESPVIRMMNTKARLNSNTVVLCQLTRPYIDYRLKICFWQFRFSCTLMSDSSDEYTISNK